MTSTETNLNESSKRRHRWENEGDFNDRQQTNVEDESRVISKINTGQIEFNSIPLQSEQPKADVTKSKWDDDDDEATTDSVQQNQIPPES